MCFRFFHKVKLLLNSQMYYQRLDISLKLPTLSMLQSVNRYSVYLVLYILRI